MANRIERVKSTLMDAMAPGVSFSMEEEEATGPVGSPTNPSREVFTAANVITFCRFLLTVVFLTLFVQHDPNTRGIALVCYAVAACTDFLDGQVARRTQTVSWLGKVMDPIMDRFLLITGVLGLVATGELPIWIAVYIIARDVYLAIAAVVLRKYRSRPLDVVYIGKIATALLMTGFVDLLIAYPIVKGFAFVNVSWLPGLNGESAAAGIFLVYAGVICSIVTTCIYTVQGFRIRSLVLRQQQ